jgi:hypothetical protein
MHGLLRVCFPTISIGFRLASQAHKRELKIIKQTASILLPLSLPTFVALEIYHKQKTPL